MPSALWLAHNEWHEGAGSADPALWIQQAGDEMQAPLTTSHMRPTVALADYDFLRATYEMLLRAPVPDRRAIDAAHARLKAAHLQLAFGLLN